MISGGSLIAIRKDAPGILTVPDGERTQLVVDSVGRLRTDGGASITKGVTATAAANTAVTLTIPAGGAGFFHHITHINISRNATVVLAGTATLVVTTTNMPGNIAWSFGNAMIAGGTQEDYSEIFAPPIRSVLANTDTTIVCPAPGANVLWRVIVFYDLRSF